MHCCNFCYLILYIIIDVFRRVRHGHKRLMRSFPLWQNSDTFSFSRILFFVFFLRVPAPILSRSAFICPFHGHSWHLALTNTIFEITYELVNSNNTYTVLYVLRKQRTSHVCAYFRYTARLTRQIVHVFKRKSFRLVFYVHFHFRFYFLRFFR